MNATQRYWVRRAELQQRSAGLRQKLVGHSVALRPLFGVAEQARQTAVFVRPRPWLPALAVGLLFFRQPRRLLRWAWKGWAGWRVLMKWRRLWQQTGRS